MRRGPYIALSALFFDDEDVMVAGERAAWLYLQLAASCRLRRSDGWITEHHISRLGVPGWRARLDALVECGLVERARGDPSRYWLPAYLKWNKSEQAYQDESVRGRHLACLRWHEQPCDRPTCADLPKDLTHA